MNVFFVLFWMLRLHIAALQGLDFWFGFYKNAFLIACKVLSKNIKKRLGIFCYLGSFSFSAFRGSDFVRQIVHNNLVFFPYFSPESSLSFFFVYWEKLFILFEPETLYPKFSWNNEKYFSFLWRLNFSLFFSELQFWMSSCISSSKSAQGTVESWQLQSCSFQQLVSVFLSPVDFFVCNLESWSNSGKMGPNFAFRMSLALIHRSVKDGSPNGKVIKKFTILCNTLD